MGTILLTLPLNGYKRWPREEERSPIRIPLGIIENRPAINRRYAGTMDRKRSPVGTIEMGIRGKLFKRK